MQRDELLATVERLCDIELDVLERDELAAVVAASARVRGWLDGVELRCSRRGRNLAAAGHAEPSAALIARNGNRSNRDANQIDRRDRVAEAMPSLEDGLTYGTVSAGHLDAIANATRNAPPEVRAAFASHEEELTAFAASESVEVFTRRCRALVAELTTELTGNDATELDRQRGNSKIRTWVDTETGMHHTLAALDPLRHEILWNAINRSLRRRQQRDGNARTPWNQMQVDSLIDAVQGGGVDPTRCRPTTPTDTPPAATPPADTAVPPDAPAPPPGPAAAPASPKPPAPASAPAPASPSASPSPPPSPAAGLARDLTDAIAADLAARGHTPNPPDPDWDDDSAAEPDTGSDNDVNRVDDDNDGEIEAELRRIEQRLPEISVLMDLAFLRGELHAHGICETEDGLPLPVSTIRRLCCDAEIIPVTLGGDGVPIDVGRTARTVNRAQRRALRAMHRTCAHPDCHVPFSHTKIHHIRWCVRDRGPTDIDNLLPLCERHHHLVHEGRWGLTMTPDRIAIWTRPDGTIHHIGCTIDRHPPTSSPPTDELPGDGAGFRYGSREMALRCGVEGRAGAQSRARSL
jgi:hypothetical protein